MNSQAHFASPTVRCIRPFWALTATRAFVLPQEVRFTVEFQPGAGHSIINSLLLPLQLDHLECSVNEVVFTSSWPLQFGGDPPLDEIPTHWCPWDDDVTIDAQYHFHIANLQVFENIVRIASATDGYISLVPDSVPFHLRGESLLIVRQLPMMQLMELVAASADRIRGLETRLAAAERSVAIIRHHLGIRGSVYEFWILRVLIGIGDCWTPSAAPHCRCSAIYLSFAVEKSVLVLHSVSAFIL